MRASEGSPRRSGTRCRRRWLLRFALVLGGGLALTAFFLPFGEGRLEAGLQEPLGEERIFRARVSGAASGQCPGSGPFCGPPPSPADDLHRRLTRLAGSTSSIPEPARSCLRGRLSLYLGAAGGSVDDAVERLEEAVELEGADAACWNDLGVAYLVAADLEGRSFLRLVALRAISRALELDPEFDAARFNHALALGALGFRSLAADAWRQVLRTAGPEWWPESRRHLEAVQRPDLMETWRRWVDGLESAAEPAEALRDLPPGLGHALRLHVEDVVLPEWGRSLSAGDVAAAGDQLDFARRAIHHMGKAGRAGLLAAAVAHLEACRGEECRDLARGHHSYGEGRRAYEEHRRTAAAVSLTEALELLARHASPFAFWPRYYRLTCRASTLNGDFGELADDFERLEAEAGDDPLARGYSAWMIAYCHMYRANWAMAEDWYRKAEERFTTAGDLENVGMMIHQRGAVLDRMGRVDESRAHWDRLVDHLPHLVKPLREQNVLSGIARRLQAEGLSPVALLVADHRVERAELYGTPKQVLYAASDLAALRIDGGDLDGARSDLVRAQRMSARVPEDTRAFDLIYLAATEAEMMEAEGRPEAAMKKLRRTVEAAREVEARLDILRNLTHLADVQARHVGRRAALATLEEAEEEVLRQRSLLDHPRTRQQFLDQARAILERKVAWLADEGSWGEALVEAESLRAPELATLLEARLGSGRPAPALPALRQGAAIVSYLSLRDRLLIWRWDAGGRVRSSVVWISRDELAQRVARLQESEARSARHGGASAEARALAWLLYPPGGLDDVERTLIVADGPLDTLTFAALPVPDAPGSHWFDLATLTHSPSMGVARRLAEAANGAPPAAASTRPLLVAATAFSSGEFPELASLDPAAVDRLHGRLGGDADVLAGADATPAAFLDRMRSHPFVAYYGHGLAASLGSGRAGLVLAPDAGGAGSGLLDAEGVLALQGPVATRFLALASCRGAAGSPSLTEGAMSLVRPFLAVGVPSVLASLGEIEAGAAEQVLERLSPACADDPAGCVRQAYLELSRDGAATPGWQRFQLYGTDPWMFEAPGAADTPYALRRAPALSAR